MENYVICQLRKFYKKGLFLCVMEKDIGKIQKGEYQGTVTDIVIGIKEYQGRVGVDIREFVTSDRYTGPTKKGLRIPAESFEKFKEMINSVNQENLVASAPSEPKEETQTTEGQEGLPDY